MPPRKNRRNTPSTNKSSCAQKGEVPDDLVGRRYASLTILERDHVRTYRAAHKLCFGCGTANHEKDQCPRRRQTPAVEGGFPTEPNPTSDSSELPTPPATNNFFTVPYRQKPAVAASWSTTTTHQASSSKPHTHKPEHEVAVGKEGEVPYEFIGVAFKDMTKEQRDTIFQFRRKAKMCAWCGSKEHQHTDCEQRDQHMARRVKRKMADVTSGKVVVANEVTGPLGRLPTELRLKIFAQAFKQDKFVEFRRNTLKHLCFSKILLPKVMEGYFSVKDFTISTNEAAKAFKRAIEFYGVASKVCSLRFSRYTRNVDGLSPNVQMEVVEMCTKLVKVKLAIYAGAICYRPYQDQEYNLPCESDWVVKRFDLAKLFTFKHIRAVCLDGIDEQWFAEWAAHGSMDGLCNLVPFIKEEYEKCGMDTYLCYTLNGENWRGRTDETFEEM